MPEDDEQVLLSIELPPSVAKEPSVVSVAQFLDVQPDQLDSEFGVVVIDPQRRLFAIMLSEDQVSAVSERLGTSVKGPYADPEIAPFGPVKDEK